MIQESFAHVVERLLLPQILGEVISVHGLDPDLDFTMFGVAAPSMAPVAKVVGFEGSSLFHLPLGSQCKDGKASSWMSGVVSRSFRAALWIPSSVFVRPRFKWSAHGH